MLDEYGDTRPLVFHTTAPGHIHTVDRQVRTLEDLEGLKVRVASRSDAAMLEALGAIPVGMPITQTYEALSRGVVEGAWIQWSVSAAVPAAGSDALPHGGFAGLQSIRTDHEQGPAMTGCPTTSGRSWTTPRAWRWPSGSAACGRKTRSAAGDLAVQRGNTILALAEPERERWRTVTAPVADDWVARVDAMGYDGQALLADAKRLIASYSGARNR